MSAPLASSNSAARKAARSSCRELMVGLLKASATYGIFHGSCMRGQVRDCRMLARQRIGRVPGIDERLETHGAGVQHDEAADQPFPEADDLSNHFERHHGAEHAGE